MIACCPLLSCCVSANKTVSFSDPNQPRYAQLDICLKPTKSDKKTIKIVSYNIELGKKIKGAKDFLSKHPELANADVICLQEMNLEALKILALALNYNYIYYPSAIHPGNNKDFGQAILSRWPIQDDQKILLPFSFVDRYIKIQKCAIGAVIVINDQPIYIVSAHLGVLISAEHRKEQVRAILAALPPEPNKCIITGDFNTYAQMHTQAIIQPLEEAGFKLATKNTGWTYKYWYLLNYRAKLDYIFYRNLELIQSGRVLNRRYSDHFPIWADFQS